MSPVFDRFTPVVDFGANSEPFARDAWRWLVWPVFACRVLLPCREAPAFNVFQRAVLDMCRAGVRDAVGIAARVSLPVDLMDFVIQQLRETGMLDKARAPTQRATRLMNEDDEPPEVEDAGYVFVDGTDGKSVWPRVHRGSLPVVNAEFVQNKDKDKDKDKVTYDLGTPGKPYRVSANVVWPGPDVKPCAPSAYAAQKAARHHARRVRAFERESFRGGGRDDTWDGLKAGGLRVVDVEPEPIFVASFVFLPRDARQRCWLVTDPVGLGVSDVLRAGVDKLASEGKYGIATLLNRVAGEAWHVDAGDLVLCLTDAARAATKRVERRLGEARMLLPREVLDRLESAEACLDGSRTAKPIEEFARNAYAAIEGVFGWLVQLYPNPDMIAALGHNAPENASLLQKTAEQLGFTTSQDVLEFLSVTRGAVEGAICFGNKSFQGRLAAALLAAGHNVGHPLATLAARMPDALEFFAEIRKLRNNASHHTLTVPSYDIAVGMRNRLFELVREIVGVGAVDVETIPSVVSLTSDILLRVRARAEQESARHPGLADRPNLRSRVIEMYHSTLLVRLLASVATEAPLKARIGDAVMALAIAMEAVFAELEAAAATPTGIAQMISENRDENAALLVTAAKAVGFTVDDCGQLPKSITHARPNRMRQAAQGSGETLSARVAVLLLAAQQKPDHPLRKVVGRCPTLILDVARLVEARGHGHDVVVTAAEVAEIEMTVENSVWTILEAID